MASALNPEKENGGLSMLEACCRLKAEASYWVSERQRLIGEGGRFKENIEPRDADLISRAKTLNCFLWMLHANGPRPGDLALFDTLGDCFSAVAEVVSVLIAMTSTKVAASLVREGMELAAEAQAALRVAVHQVGGGEDSDQRAAFQWLLAETGARRLHVERFMKADDPGDPGSWRRVLEKADELRQQMEEARRQRELLNKARFHQKRIVGCKGTDHDWQIVATAVDSLVSMGMPASNADVRGLVRPLVGLLPSDAEWPEGFERVLSAAKGQGKTKKATTSRKQRPQSKRRISSEVAEVARLLEGRTIVLIGGDKRKDAAESLKKAFRLKQVKWFPAREHGSPSDFKDAFAGPDVAVVLQALRWTRYSLGNLKHYCSKYGKEFVRLPNGYGVNQVAKQILGQCGWRLANRRRQSSE